MMMKNLILFVTVVVGAILIYFFLRYNYSNNRNTKGKQGNETLEIKTPKAEIVKIKNKSIFNPYWSLEEMTGDYNRYIYFGITADDQGIDKNEAGYINLDKFVKLTQGKESLLTLRLLNDDFNRQLLKDEALQQKIIEQTLAVLKEKNLSGVVLDLELFSLFSDNISGQINSFVKRFYTAVKLDYRSFGVLIYGDVFFRHRPFDIGFIAKNSDEILVMAYDFHKSRGEPGPNFPLARRSDNGGGLETQTYDYDFKTMVKDFKKVVPTEKLSIIFGMFGYDWTVDEKKRPFAPAKALTLKEIKAKFKCNLEDCVSKRDKLSAETEINYTVSSDQADEQGVYRIDYHIVWYEDEGSVKVKSRYLEENGIGSIGYWAWGFF